MRPFQYPPFPNAQFGTADRLPDPAKGPLSRDYITNPLLPYLCGVTSTPYDWCQETDYLISGYTRIEGYSPGKKNTGRAKPSSTATLTSRKRKVIEVTSGVTESPTKVARTAQTLRKKEHPLPLPKSNIETARAILSNPAKAHRTLSLGLAAMYSSHASTDSTKVEYTPLGHETNPVWISSSCPVSASMAAATSSYLASPQPEIIITSPKLGKYTKSYQNMEDSPPKDAPKSQAIDPELILKKVNQILACLNYSLEEIVANVEVKAQLLEATTFLNQHASSEAGSLEKFMEELFNSNNLLESSSEELRQEIAELAKQKQEVTKCDQAISKVRPMLEMGSTKEEEAKLAEKALAARIETLEKELAMAKEDLAVTRGGLSKIKATNSNLKAKLSMFEEMKASNHSKCVAAIKAMEEAEAKHKQVVEASTRLSRRHEELKLSFRVFLK
ncbi:hypothetical protein PIB30_081342 [Stylosanthes scabra]|uniref:Uncharacterized protein n=1 Tax=Stylosanthes scabra TaxID=79078 RepID=A0ABU6UVF2_9FABA|nr:hypothetical protein [Stylosanthes scabra]